MKKTILILLILTFNLSQTFAINIEASDKIIDVVENTLWRHDIISNNIGIDYGNDLKLLNKYTGFDIGHSIYNDIHSSQEYTKISKKNEVYSFLESKLGAKKLEKAIDNGEIYPVEPSTSDSSRGRLDFGTGSESSLELDKIHIYQSYTFKSDKNIKNYKIRFYLIDPIVYGGYMSQGGDAGNPIKAKLVYYNDIDLAQNFWSSASMTGSGYILQKYKYKTISGIKDDGYSLIPYVDYSLDIKKGLNLLNLGYYKYISPYSPHCGSLLKKDCGIYYKIENIENY